MVFAFDFFGSSKRAASDEALQDVFRTFWQEEYGQNSTQSPIVQKLNNHGIRSLWHFTDSSNLSSIQKHGILTLRDVETRGIHAISGSDRYSKRIDRSKGLDRYVHLALTHDHPMCYVAQQRGSIVDPVWIELDISIVDRPGTRCSSRNANRYPVFPIARIEETIDMDRLMMPVFDPSIIEARKAEILIKDSIPTHYIKEIHYGNKTHIFDR